MNVPERTRGALSIRARRSPFARRVRIPVLSFIHAATAGGVALLSAVVIALIWANSPWADLYHSVWTTELSLRVGSWSLTHDLRYWVNDGLMTWFFFVVALEIKRELAFGELSTTRRAALPVFAALGGMVVPVAIFLLFNFGGPGARGWGITMATDIAFALGVLALVGDRVSNQTRIFLLGLAVVDDVGAILVIAFAYIGDLSLPHLGLAFLIFGFMLGALKLGVRNPVLYVVGSVIFWFSVLLSGVHATIAGVAVGLLVPATPFFRKEEVLGELSDLTHRFEEALDRGQDEVAEEEMGAIEELALRTEPPVERLERLAHPFSSYFVLPVFALANAGLTLPGGDGLEQCRPERRGLSPGRKFDRGYQRFIVDLREVGHLRLVAKMFGRDQ